MAAYDIQIVSYITTYTSTWDGYCWERDEEVIKEKKKSSVPDMESLRQYLADHNHLEVKNGNLKRVHSMTRYETRHSYISYTTTCFFRGGKKIDITQMFQEVSEKKSA